MSTTTTKDRVRTGLAGFLDRVTSVIRLVRPVDRPPPPYKTCAGCRRGGRDDQHVPDPDQFTTKKGVTAEGDVVGNPAAVPGKPAVDVDAEVDGFIHYGSGDPGIQAARISDDLARRGGYGPDVKLMDAPPVWCAPCGKWYHAIKCYSLHKHND